MAGELGPAEPTNGGRAARSRARLVLEAMRPHQWAKNLLVFVALIGAHRVAEPALLARAALAFVAFGLVASSVYVLNDLCDLAADRRHATKRDRPFASGALPLRFGYALFPLLLAAGAAVAAALPRGFGVLLGGYYAATVAYSFALKRRLVLDVVVLASLYTARLFGGGLATDVPISEWLAAFSLFVFFSLALAKRASELGELGEREGAAAGRGYVAADRGPVITMGIASGYLAVLVLALYVSSHDVSRLYAHPLRLWLLCPVLLYWTSRVWILVGRRALHEDPVLFALRDPASWLVALAGAAVLFLAS
jgi:4-hydroxybenzoate polyprenyltransferase